jgi:hypothetical protein
MSAPALEFIRPKWPAPPQVRVVSTTRAGGVSTGPYASLNLALHVGDDAERVRENRGLLRAAAGLPSEPLWLEQVHGIEVVTHAGQAQPATVPPRADASVAFEPGRVCTVMTADCLPVVLADRAGTRVGVAHAGWRGLAGGVLEATIAALKVPPKDLLAWLGPAIAQPAFEVGPEVRQAFVQRWAAAAGCFAVNAAGRYQADIYGLARVALAAAGVEAVHGGGWCTQRDSGRFFSFRRDAQAGRMATLAWLA